MSAYIPIQSIKEAVARTFHVSVADLESDRRAQASARPRQVAMYLCKKLTSNSLPVIGRHFGGRDHTTVMHAGKRIEDLMISDGELRRTVRLLEESIPNRYSLGEDGGLHLDLDKTIQSTTKSAITELQCLPFATLTGARAVILRTIASEFNQHPIIVMRGRQGEEIILMANTVKGTWSLLRICGEDATILETGTDFNMGVNTRTVNCVVCKHMFKTPDISQKTCMACLERSRT